MPFCPNCGGEYPLGQTRCPECDLELTDIQKRPDDLSLDFGGEPVLLCKTGDMAGAELLSQAFADEDIPCVMNPGPVEFRMFPLEYGQKSIRVYVPESLVEQAGRIARRILADFVEEEGEDDEDN
jgi:hypothetical protein